jgi:hypothetical protein
VRKGPRHPKIDRVVHEEVGQDCSPSHQASGELIPEGRLTLVLTTPRREILRLGDPVPTQLIEYFFVLNGVAKVSEEANIRPAPVLLTDRGLTDLYRTTENHEVASAKEIASAGLTVTCKSQSDTVRVYVERPGSLLRQGAGPTSNTSALGAYRRPMLSWPPI